jgi:Haem-binding domain
MLKNLLRRGVIGLVVLFIVAQFIRPAKTNPAIDPAQTMQAHTQMTPEVPAIMQRACADCHSNQTQWPWYSNIAPVSWFVINHVNEGREHLNFSEWAKSDHKKMLHQFEEIEKEVSRHEMPIISYTLIHRAATLSEQEVRTLVEWAKSERQRMQQ